MNIKQFQEIYFIYKSKDIDIDKSVKMVAAIKGITPDDVDKMSIVKFNKISNEIQNHFELLGKKIFNSKPKNYTKIDGKLFKINYDVRSKSINAAKYVETITFGNEVVENLHKIMASIVSPIRFNWKKLKYEVYEMEHELIASYFEKCDFEIAYHSSVFFYLLYKTSMTVILPYLENELMKKGADMKKARETMMNFQNILDGFIMPNWCLNLNQYLSNRFGI